MVARLPQPGSDDGTWGDILNQYLQISHDSTGKLLTSAVQSAGAVTSVNGKTPTGGVVTLTPADIGPGDALSLRGAPVDASSPSDGQALIYNATAGKWAPATVTNSGTVSDATTGSKGVVQLAGDLGGTASAPTIGSGVITDAKISSSAAIAQSKISGLSASLSAKAPLASPTFSGTVTVPTPSNATDAATKAYVDTAASAVATPDATSGTKGKVQLAGDLAGTAASPTVAKLNGISVSGAPTNGQVLTASGATAAQWTTPSAGFGDPTTTKGDLIVHGTSTTRLAVGSDGQVLTADSAQSSGVKWAAATSTVNYAGLPAGTNISVDYDVNAASYPSRPTARTDIIVIWRGPSQPSSMLNGDEWKVTP